MFLKYSHVSRKTTDEDKFRSKKMSPRGRGESARPLSETGAIWLPW